MADAVRLAVLYKIGGLYTDLDMLHIRPGLDHIHNSSILIQERFTLADEKWYIEDESWMYRDGYYITFQLHMMNNGIFAFPKNSPILFELMRRYILYFEPDYKWHWGENGPRLFTILSRDCFYKINEFENDGPLRNACLEMKFIPWKLAYPLHWSQSDEVSFIIFCLSKIHKCLCNLLNE